MLFSWPIQDAMDRVTWSSPNSPYGDNHALFFHFTFVFDFEAVLLLSFHLSLLIPIIRSLHVHIERL